MCVLSEQRMRDQISHPYKTAGKIIRKATLTDIPLFGYSANIDILNLDVYATRVGCYFSVNPVEHLRYSN